MEMVADKCARCGKIVIKHDHAASSDMIHARVNCLYMGDLKPGEGGRPTLQLEKYGDGWEGTYCPDCFLAVVKEWVEKLKARGNSDIPLSHVLQGKVGVSSPCPVCGR